MENRPNYLSLIVTGIAGSAIGAGISWFFTKRYYTNKYQQELEAYKQHFDEKIGKLEAQIMMLQGPTVSIKEDPKTAKNENESDSEDKKQYKSIIKQHYDFSEDDLEDEDEAISEAAAYMKRVYDENPIEAKPHIISMDAYTGEDDVHYKDNYGHVTLDYYAGDNVLCQAELHSEVVPNPADWVGYSFKEHFGDEEFGNDPDCVYVRNDQMRMDFEIIRDKGYYCQIILGIDPPDEDDEDDDS